MRELSSIQKEIVAILADGKCYSGETLGDTLKLSRTAIWKHINKLSLLEFPIIRIPKQGYQLAQGFIPLNANAIRDALPSKIADEIDLYSFSSIDSTNNFLKNLSINNPVSICFAEKQVAGRGRFGRHWVSPFGENIYFSLRRQIDSNLSRLSGLSLIVGLSILRALKQANITQEIKIKWPNDLMWNDKKLCGVLVEIMAESNSSAEVIIGIGLNVNSQLSHQTLFDHSWCSLYEITQKFFNRNHLIANLIDVLLVDMAVFFKQGLQPFAADWKAADFLQEKSIIVSHPSGNIAGKACGIDEHGHLCLQDEWGKIYSLASGDTTILK